MSRTNLLVAAVLIAEDDPPLGTTSPTASKAAWLPCWCRTCGAARRSPDPIRAGVNPNMTSARSPDIGPPATARYLTANALLAVTAIVGGLVILALTAASAGIYDAVAEKDGVSSLDQPTLDHVIAMRTPLASQVLTVFTHLGGLLGMTLIASAVTLLLVWRLRSLTPPDPDDHRGRRLLTFTTVGKAIVGRARPPLSDAVPPYERLFPFLLVTR